MIYQTILEFFVIQISVYFAIASLSKAALIPRNAPLQRQNETISQCPLSTNIEGFLGTWYLAGVASNAWNEWQSFTKGFDFTLNCAQISLTKLTNSSIDAIETISLSRTSSGVRINATAAIILDLALPTPDFYPPNHDLAWYAYTSQFVVNRTQWEIFVNNGQGDFQNATDGSIPVPGTEPAQVTIKVRPLDSVDHHPTNIDTLFVWVPHANEVYGAIFSKYPCIDQSSFNKVTNMLPSAFNNISFVLLDGCCNSRCSY